MKKLYKLFLISLVLCYSQEYFAGITTVHVSTKDVDCNGDLNGYVTVDSISSTAPSGPYTITITTTPVQTINVGDTVFGLGQATYTIRVTDLGDPAQIFPFNVNAVVGGPLPLISNIASTPASCFGRSDGQAFVQALQGTAPYTYLWDDPSNSTSASIGSLAARTYNVTVTDDNSCTTTNSIVVSQNPQIIPNATATPIDCNGAANGTVLAAASGGSGSGYTYAWNDPNNSTTPGVNSLGPRSYTVTVTDSDNCTATQTVNISEPPAITISIAPDTIDCFGTSTGTAVATVNGGTPPYSYSWNGQPVTGSNTENNLAAGPYTVQVTDANGCNTPVTPFNIEQRNELMLGLDSTDVTCFADGDGTITGTITGGVGPYSWVADDPAGTSGTTPAINISGLNGNRFYRVTVTDNLGCPKVDSIFVNEPAELIASFLNTTEDPNCAGTPTGKIDITFSGGNGGETFNWSGPSINAGNQTQQNQSNLLQGLYSVTITDAKGCDVIIDTNLVDPLPILGNLTFDQPKCLGGGDARVIATPTDGSGVYTNYEFGDGAATLQNGTDSILTGLSAGTYFVTITDSDGCTGTDNIVVSNPTNPFALDIVADSVNCNGESTGGATATPRVPLTTGPYTWSWSNTIGGATIGTDSIITGLPIGKYFISATDGNGCQIIDSIEIEQPDPIGTTVTGVDLNCNGDASGTASATISNGNAPYSWVWLDGTTTVLAGNGATASVGGLSAKKYYFDVTDREGCTKRDSITLTEPNAFVLTEDSFRLVKCSGENNGALFVTNSGGTTGPGFPTYTWNDGPTTTQDRTDLVASATPYKVVATDQNGCKDSVIRLITEPNPLALSIVDTDSLSCPGADDGSATVAASGGTVGNGYVYTWSTTPVQTSATATGLAPGNYTVFVTDSNGCTTNPPLSVDIFAPTSITTTISSDSASCSGFNDGSATVVAQDGTPFPGPNGYTYLWDTNAGSQTTATATNLLANAPNFYRVTVTDRNGCEKVDSVQVGQPNTLTLSVSSQGNVDCAGNATGTATITVVGGTLPYTYVWENTGNLGVDIGTNNATLSGLPADTFRVTVTDGGGCNDNIQVIITEPDTLKGSITASLSPSCLGSTDGTATVSASGGSLLPASDYSYSWNTNPVQTTQTATGLEADVTYIVTITDDSSCVATVNVTLTAPNVFLTNDSNIQNVSCFGGDDGFIRVTPQGGTPFNPPAAPYNISWTSPTFPSFTANGDSIFDLFSGQYIALIQDSRGCLARDTFNLDQPGTSLSLSFDTTDVSCVGADNGTAKVFVNGGTPGYTYNWIGTTFGNVDSIFGLASGTYRVEVTDNNGCIGLDSTVINPPTPILLNVDPNNPVQDVTCAGDADGAITVLASGGSGALNLEWYRLPNRTATIATNTNTQTNLSGGTYRILVIDGPCSDSIDVVVNEPDSIKANLNRYDVSCDGTVLGRAALTNITGGNLGGYSFNWTPDPGAANGQGTDSIFNLNAGSYQVTITDPQGCTFDTIFSISATQVTFNFTDSVRDDSCVNAGKGFVGINGITGGVAPYTYEWFTNGVSNGPAVNDPFIDNLTTGLYSVIIRDAAGCDSNHTFRFLAEPAPITFDFDTTDVGCAGADNGTIKANISGGTPPYTYDWVGTAFGDVDSIFGLATGTYRLSVTDANGCTGFDSTVVNPALPISITIDPNNPVNDVTCAGDGDGSITIVTTGATGNFVNEWYLLPNRATTFAGNVSTLNNLNGGTYRVLVFDGPCVDSLDVIVGEPDTLKADVIATDISCDGSTLGTAVIRNITGGNGGLTYTWSPDPGVANGQGTDSVFNLAANNYGVIVQDVNGCNVPLSFNVNQTISNFTFIDSVRNDSCQGASKGYVGIENLSGGIPPYSFQWSNSSGTIVSNDPFLDNIPAETYSVIISDAAGCDSTFTFPIVTEPNPFSVTIIAVDDTCLQDKGNASIDPTSILGGTAPFTFTWPGNISGQAVTGLTGDNAYQLTITDANLCTYTEDFTIGNVAPFTISFDIDSASCKDFPTGAIRTTTNGQSTGQTTYTWSANVPSGAGPDISGLLAGDYRLTVTDAAGCEATDTATVEEPDKLIFNSVLTTPESCIPGNDGKAQAFATGGNQGYRFNWGDGLGFVSSDSITGLLSGNYSVTVQDRKFCSAETTYQIGDSTPFQITAVIDTVTCPGDKDGAIKLNLVGAVAPVSYAWSSPALAGQTDNPTGLGVGSYSVVVTDGSTCTVSQTIVVPRKSSLQVAIRKEDETCNPGNDGYAVAAGTNGVEPYSYAWDTNVTNFIGDSAFNLAEGDYFVTTTDALGCTFIASTRIASGANLGINIISQSGPLCFGGIGSRTIEGTGGVAPYSFTWNDGTTGPTNNNLRAGSTASIIIRDSSVPPCEKTELLSIAPIDPISLTVTTTLESCAPGSDGRADVAVDKGVGPFTYAYTGTGTNNGSRYENLVADNYTVTVTDANGCTSFTNFTIGDAANLPFAGTITGTDPTCANGTDGSFTTTVTGGINSLTYTWVGGNGNASSADPTGLSAGIYTVTITRNDYNCSIQLTDTLFNKAPITASFVTVKDDCPPANTGSATIDAANGVAPYTYAWPTSIAGSVVSGANGEIFSNLPSGTFNVTITDFIGCQEVLPFIIEKSAPFTLTTNIDSVTCNGLSDANITLSVSGVSTPNTETYSWSGPGVNPTAQSQTGLGAGIYSVTVTDPGNNCEETETYILSEPDTITVVETITNVSCNGGGSDGRIDLRITGGTPPYSIDWGGGISANPRTGLPIGNYTVSITDASNCAPFVATYNITNQPQFTVSLDSTDVSCPGLRNGFITVATNANSPAYAWSDGLSTSSTRGGLFAGTYTVTVTDGITGCSVVDSTTINEEDSLKMFFTVTDENCVPGADAFVVVDSTNGGTSVPNYTYQFSRGNRVGNNAVNQLTAGKVFVTVTDGAGCTAVDSVTVIKSAPFNASFIFTDAICAGDSSGTASIITSNSSGPLTFTWPLGSVPNIRDSTQNRLAAGTYIVNVFDPVNGCDEDFNIVIDEPDSIRAVPTIVDENCNPGGNGSITLNPTGGDGTNYTYNWSGAGVIAGNQNQTGLSAGKYFVTITDGNSCVGIDSINVGFIISTIPNLVTTDDGCQITGPCAGSAKVSPTGGIAPYTFEWASSSGPIIVSNTTDSIGQLCTGNYSVKITDNSGCDTTVLFTISGNRTILPNAVVVNESCGATDNGSISVTPSGGDAPYTYAWSNSTAIDSIRTNLAPGNYSVTITDATGCIAILDTIVGTENFVYSISSTDLSCNGGNDGTADISITGGTAGFTFVWSPAVGNGQGTPNVSDLSVGTYSVVITNTNNGCAVTETVDIRPATFINPNEVVVDESCFGQNDGSITLGVVGGAGGYIYNWSSNVPAGTTGPIASGLGAGTYTVQIIDAAGCDTTITADIIAANDILASVTENDATCTNSGICDGSAVLTVTSAGTFSYVWSSGITVVGNDSAAVNLCPGNYFVDITNAIGCTKRVNFVIGGPALIDPNITVTNAVCNIPNGALSASPTGGTGALTVEWLDNNLVSIGSGNNINSLPAGAYFADVVDATGCRDTFPTSINDQGSENITISAFTNVSCFGGNDGTATVSFVCSDPGCTTEWFEAGGTSVGTGRIITGLSEGDYYVEVTNNSGCLAVETVTISEPSGLSISETIVSNDCSGGITGSITLSVSGGAGNFNYLWTPSPTNGQGTNSVSGLAAGTYTVVITDGNGCDSTLSFDIIQPNIINSTFTTSNANCNQADGEIIATVTGGTVATPLAYNYQWFDGNNTLLVGQTTDTLRNVASGNYRLRVRDDNSCERLFTVSLSDLNGPTVIVDSLFNAGCFGENNGGIFITASGNNPPFNYNWSPSGAVSEDLTNLAAGAYSVQVTDDIGCITIVDTNITESTEIMAVISAADATCGICNGTASVSVTGGNAPYTYLWSDGATANNTDSLCGGNYSLVVTDATGCSKSFDFGVNTIGGPTGETVTVSPASCANSNDGSASVVPIGGTAPYSYLWQHNGATTNSLNNLAAGTYFVQISDVRSCSRTVEIIIQSPTAIELNPQVISSTCNQADGSILLNVTGGLPPYSYNWFTASLADTNFIDNKPAGLYPVSVTDANGCVESLTIAINNSGLPFVPNPIVTDVSCFGQCDGSLENNIATPGVVDFIWLDNQRNSVAPINTDVINSACAGKYFLELTTIPEGCISYVPVTITEPDSITLSSNIIKNISCNGDCDGEIFINTRGGNILYTYSWSDPNNQSKIPASGLCAGTYTVTATDANGCTAETSTTLIDPPVLTASITSNTNLVCSSDCDATATSAASGGNLPYTYSWSGGQTAANPTNLCFGENILTVTDANGCSISDTIMISATDTVIAISSGNPLVCDGDIINLIGDTIGSSVANAGWYLDAAATNLFTNSLDTSFTAPIGTYTYYLVASSASGLCVDIDTFTVTVAPNPLVNLQSQIRRFGEEQTVIVLGNEDPSYTYKWTPPTDLDFDSIAEPTTFTEEDITYSLIVTDTNGCTYIDSILVLYLPNIDVPSGFTPNGDGTNDVWNIRLLEKFPNASVQIYNRWGTLLFEQSNGYSTPWDGTYDGEELPIGTYYYIIDLKDPIQKPLTGPITIVR